jgi:hypothetical protein
MISEAAAQLPPLPPPPGTPSENAHLKLLALLYKHGITKGAAMEAGGGGVADIEMLRFRAASDADGAAACSEWTRRLKEAGAYEVWFTCAHQLSKPSLVEAMLQELDKMDEALWKDRETCNQIISALINRTATDLEDFEGANLVRTRVPLSAFT